VGGLGLAAYRRLREVWDLVPPSPPLSTPAGEGLVLAEVTYTYPGGRRPALEEVSLEIAPGERVAVVGPSGAGKSTLAEICRGLRVPERGAVSVMGRPPGPDVVVYVGQGSHVFEGTVSYNLRVARPDATAAEVEDACRRARLLEVVEALPDGFATRLGQGGTGLSGGEVQRLALARAFLSPAPLVVLDEATSGLDLETEALVTDAVFDLLQGRTALVVAHRVTTARRCDRIVRLEAGRVTAEGSATEMAPLLAEMTGGGP
jgi:ABC-type multidrug transport system fused ATPase/permease subunit